MSIAGRGPRAFTKVYPASKRRDSAIGRRKFRNADLHHIPKCPQVMTLRIVRLLYFGSVEHVEAEWKALRAERRCQKHVIFHLKRVGKIDLSGADFLTLAICEVRAAGCSFHPYGMSTSFPCDRANRGRPYARLKRRCT